MIFLVKGVFANCMSRKITALVGVLMSIGLVTLSLGIWNVSHNQTGSLLDTETDLSNEAARRTVENLVTDSFYIEDTVIPLSDSFGYNVSRDHLVTDSFYIEDTVIPLSDSFGYNVSRDHLVTDSFYIEDTEIPLSDSFGYNVYQTHLVKDTIQKINKIRIEHGLSALQWTAPLNVAAMIRAKECSIKWSHTRPNGQDFWTVDSKCVYGENLAFGYDTADEVVSAWMASPSHKDNILYPEFRTIALAIYKAEDGTYYWANEFGISSNSNI